MRVDSMHSDANLQRLQNKYSNIFSVIVNKQRASDVLTYLDHLGLEIKANSDNQSYDWAIEQITFFKLVDFISLCCAHCSIGYRAWLINEITKADVKPFRRNLASTTKATLGFLKVSKSFNLTKDMCTIDSYNNLLRLTNAGLECLFYIIDTILTDYITGVDTYAYCNWYGHRNVKAS